MDIFTILEAAEATTKRLAKEDLLRKLDDQGKAFIVAALDPYVTYGLQNLECPPPAKGAGVLDLPLFFDLLSDLAHRDLVGNEARGVMTRVLSNMPALEQKWCYRCLLKNLRCGVDAKTVNKIWPGLVPSFNVALADTLEATASGGNLTILEKLEYPVWVDYKLDGIRIVAVKAGSNVQLFTRKGHEVDVLPTIAVALQRAEGDFVLDGEAMGANWNEAQSALFSTKNRVDDSSIVYQTFDCTPLEEWRAGKSTTPYSARRDWLVRIVSVLVNDPHVQVIPGVVVNNEGELRLCYRNAIEAGFEGVMLKKLGAVYSFKRSKAIMKLKPKQTWEGTIVGWERGDPNGKWADSFGAFKVRFTKEGPITSVGGGFTDEQRKEIWWYLQQDTDYYTNKVAEVEGQEMTKDGVVRFPVFKRFRSEYDVS